jgi:hypothetical protein
MTTPYTPPSASVVEQITYGGGVPSIVGTSDVCLVGVSQGYITVTDQIAVTVTGSQTLPTLVLNPGASLSSVISVVDATTIVSGGTSYTYATPADYSGTTGSTTPGIFVTGTGAIAQGITARTTVLLYVTYQYVPANYYSTTRCYDFASVQSLYGPAFNTAGTAINSLLSYGAFYAFQNGASSVICQPLFARATPGNPATAQQQPTAANWFSSTTWADSLYVLRTWDNIDIIVPVAGQSQVSGTDAGQLGIFEAVQDHQVFMNTEEQFLLSIFGEDSSASTNVAQMATIRSHVQTLQSRYSGTIAQQNVMINTSNFSAPLPSSTQTSFAVGGQYVACAIAGALASQTSLSSSLTRQVLSGFVGVLDTRLVSDKNIDAGDGLMVIDQPTNTTQARVRHAITTDTSGPARSELNVIRAKFAMIESIKVTLENQIIGRIIADANSPYVVRSAISGVLSLLQQAGDIVSYTVPVCTLSSLLPTTIQAVFSYRPAFTLNYVQVTFSLDLTNSVITTASSSTTG